MPDASPICAAPADLPRGWGAGLGEPNAGAAVAQHIGEEGHAERTPQCAGTTGVHSEGEESRGATPACGITHIKRTARHTP